MHLIFVQQTTGGSSFLNRGVARATRRCWQSGRVAGALVLGQLVFGCGSEEPGGEAGEPNPSGAVTSETTEPGGQPVSPNASEPAESGSGTQPVAPSEGPGVQPDDVAPVPTSSGELSPAGSGGTGVEPNPTPSSGATGEFSVTITPSAEIQTVGIVEWSTTETIDQATIVFGRDSSSPEYEVDVDLSEPNYRTLLLGMKPNETYFVQVRGQGGGSSYASEVITFETGPLPNGLPPVTVADTDSEALYGGFTVNCTGAGGGAPMGGFGGGGLAGGGGGADNWVFILDKDGEHVWTYDIGDTEVAQCSRARMSYDGKYMWVGNFSNVSPDGALVRVTMDGLTESMPYSFPGRHHDFAILPNGNVLLYEQENGGGYEGGGEGPDIIYEFNPETGDVTELYHQNTDFAAQIEEEGAHTNQINYVPELNAISFSLRHTSTIGVISYPEGELMAIFGGPSEGFGISWSIQHGHHVTDDSILIFNNEGSQGGSSVLGYSFESISASSATPTLDYSSGVSSLAFGDVKRLPNGNIFVTYSTSGVFHEIDAEGNLLREMTTDSIGYSEHRKTLYGPPPPFDE